MKTISIIALLTTTALVPQKSMSTTAYEVHCSTESGRVIQLLFRKTPYHIVSVNGNIVRIIHIENIDKLTPESDYLIESVAKEKQTYRLSCKRIE